MSVLVVFTLPAEWAGGGPCLDDELVGLFEPLPVVGRRRVMGNALTTGAPDPAGDQATVGYQVNHGKLFHQPERVIPDGQDITHENDLCFLGDAGEDGRLNVHRAAHAERSAVVLVQHQAVKAHLFCVNLLV